MIRKWRISLLLIVLASFVVAISPEKAYACSCIVPQSPLQSLAGSDAVFLGKVINTEGIPRGNVDFVSDDDVIVTFEVSEMWKGPPSMTLEIVTALEGATCGLGRSFALGEEYVVYAHGEDGNLSTNLCTRTAHVDNAQEDLLALSDPDLLSPNNPGMIPQPSLSNFLLYLILSTGVVGIVLLIRRHKG